MIGLGAAPGLVVERTGSGEPLVLVHGIGASRRVWDPVLPALARHHDVVTLDLPGFGDSPPLHAGVIPSVPAQADAVERELDVAGIGAVHVAGNSMGGWIALELAARGRARTVVGLSPAGGWTRGEARYAWLVITALRAGTKLSRPLLTERVLRPAAVRAALTWFVNSRGARIEPAAAAAAMRVLADAPAFAEARDWLLANRPQGLEQIACPAVIAWGTKDRLLSPRQGPRIAAMIPSARLVELPGLGHVPMSDDPELVARVILEATGALPA